MIEIGLFFVGIVVGVMNAVAGGGLLLGFPILLAAGLTPLMANVTGNVVLLPGQLGAVLGYRTYIRKVPKQYILLLIPCFIGAGIGAVILRNTSSMHFQKIVPGLLVFAILLFAFQPLLHFHLRRHMSKRNRDIQTLWIIGLALLPTAIYGGFFGAGFGFIMLAFLSFTSLRDTHQMNGLKNVAGMTIAATSLVVLYSTHHINWPLGLSMGAGNAVGGYYGARFSQRVSSHAIRVIVILVGVSAAVYLTVRTY